MTPVCPAAQVIVSLIPIVGITFAAIVIFFGLLWKHNEIKMRISKNEYKPQVFNWKIFSLFAGLCLVGVGFAITILFFLISGRFHILFSVKYHILFSDKHMIKPFAGCA